jgi:NAD(P)-dependent dehydrogenase (short-subunit alcohol dehydrogenase family)
LAIGGGGFQISGMGFALGSSDTTPLAAAARAADSKGRLAFASGAAKVARAPAGARAGEDDLSLFDLAGKVAVVTGSSRGIGRAIVERMADEGARVVVSSRKIEPCAEVAAAINVRCGAGRAIAVAANISSKEDLRALADETRKTFGRIDILVCNAASNPYFGPLSGISDDQFRKILDNNIVANHWLIQFVAPEMIERKEGAIVIVSSIGGLKGDRAIGAYNISKAADFQLARNLAVEFGPHNVRVNCIAPGLIKTEFARALWENPETLKRSTARTPLGRIGMPDEIAGAAIFLSSAAGSFVTGQTIVVDGGATIT